VEEYIIDPALTEESPIGEKMLQRKLLIIQVLVFVIPFLIFSFIINEGRLLMTVPQLIMYVINLFLILTAFIILRQIFDRFQHIAVTLEKVDAGEISALPYRKDLDELRGVTVAFNNVMGKFEKTVEELRVCRLTIEKDAMERLSIQEALRESESRLKSLLASTEDIIVMQDLDGKILYYNAPPRYGIAEKDVIGKTPYDVFDAGRAQWFMEHIRRVTTTLKSEPSETKIVRQGKSYWLLLLTSPVVNDMTHQVTAVTTIARNITDRKQMEEKINNTRRLESLGILAGGIAHDFNNLLTAILGYIGLAMMNLTPGESVHDKLQSAESASLRAKDLTQRLIALSPGAILIKEELSLADLMKKRSGIVLSGSTMKSDVNITDDLWPVSADKEQIGQVLDNLLMNAIEASSHGDTVTLHAANTISTIEDGLPIDPGRYVRMSVEDNGRGIPQDNLSRVFDPYFTTKELGATKGMGLGLAVCHSIIRRHNGCITVDSAEGHGTTFSIYMPALEASSATE
jgi:two-component system, cell cycle sensor histidine kinase and response regulator CckA